MIFAAYTASRPAELVDGSVRSKRQKTKLYDLRDPWDESDNSDFDDGISFGGWKKRSKSLCYEDISRVLLRNSRNKTRNVLAMEVTLSHHKGSDNKPKP